jgi:peptidoglycan hydrolase-like protein with peptidoglycan-binding domain
MRRGSTGPAVKALKERLSKEHYFAKGPPFDATFGADLEEAVKDYQRHHQIRVTGSTYGTFRSSLNKPAKWRAQQLALNLERWRESNVDHSDDLYLMVNIPQFTVEVWEEGQRQMHFPIVVGNTRSETNKKTGETKHPNHTPELSAYIDRVIYNPYWNVTDRIRKEEILPKARKSLEEKYLTKLRAMRKKVQEHEAKQEKKPFFKRIFDGKSGDDPKPESSETRDDTQAANEKPTEDDTYLVAQGPNREGGETQAGVTPPSELEDSEEADESGESEESAQAKEKAAEEKEKQPEVDISDLYREGKEDFLEQKIIHFNVDKIRELIAEVRAIESDGQKTETPSAAKDQADEKKTSPLKKALPYLDPETGKVDVSETDPDNIPEWYEENDYEVMYPGQKWEYVRQKQGDENALGRVKVIFPNPYSVYLHDTPKKDLFSQTLRAFSHGCMRMEKPMEMAKFLLKHTGQWEDVNVPRLMRGKKKMVKDEETGEKKEKTVYTYKPIFLKDQIPVHVEYFTVRPAEDGRAVFFADVYKKDLKAIKGEDALKEE